MPRHADLGAHRAGAAPPGAGLDQQPARTAQAQLAAEHGPFQPSLFDQRNLIELTSEQFPGERLIVCRNALLAEQRARKRTELLAATELDVTKIAAATQRSRRALRGEKAIAFRVGRVINGFRMAKHFELTVTDTALTWTRKTGSE